MLLRVTIISLAGKAINLSPKFTSKPNDLLTATILLSSVKCACSSYFESTACIIWLELSGAYRLRNWLQRIVTPLRTCLLVSERSSACLIVKEQSSGSSMKLAGWIDRTKSLWTKVYYWNLVSSLTSARSFSFFPSTPSFFGACKASTSLVVA